MNVAYVCPACQQGVRGEFGPGTAELVCPACRQPIEIPEGAVAHGQLQRCLVCPSRDLYVRKDFPQRLGVLIVVIGVVGSSIAWAQAAVLWTFAILFATALADLLLYAVVGNSLMCYRCHAQYRGVADMETHGAFDLETHERYRQLAARLNHPTEHEHGSRPTAH